MNYIGNTLTIRLEWRDANNALQTPSQTTLTIDQPDGSAVSPPPDINTVSAGVQTATYTPAQSGFHYYRAVAQNVGGSQVVIQDKFYVEPENV